MARVSEGSFAIRGAEGRTLSLPGANTAVLLPCYNEELTIGEVVRAFRASLPSAQIYVYDNNSTDRTRAVAEAAGAIVRSETMQGKGNVVRRMFADVEADIYLLADGDGTYDASSANTMIELMRAQKSDMIVGARKETGLAYRNGHKLGNLLFNRIVRSLFGGGFTDIFSGYRAVSRRFAKSFPAASSGFEIETELSVHALDLRIATTEIELPYKARPLGSVSKLNTYRDGFRISWRILNLFKELKPFLFFCVVAAAFALAALGLGLPVLHTYVETGMVPRFPTAILAMGLMQLSFLSLTCGLILESVSEGRREFKRMRYLDLRAVADSEKLAEA